MDSIVWLWMVMFTAVSLAVACTVQRPTPSTPTSAPTITASAGTTVPPVAGTPATPMVGLGKTSTYRDSAVGFELDYPTNWRIHNVNEGNRQSNYAYSVTPISWPANQDPQNCYKCQDIFPAGGTKIDIVVFNSGFKTLNEAILARRQEFEQAGLGQKVVTTETWTLNTGLIAQRWLVESQSGQAAEMLTAINNRTVILGGLGDYTLFDAVARTVRRISK